MSSLELDKVKAWGYKIYVMKFTGYICLVLLVILALVPTAVAADG